MPSPRHGPGGRPLFVYGTLRPGEANHAPVLRGRIARWEPAVLPGALLYHGPGYPYAVDGPAGSRVRGELLHPLPEAYEAVLADLDRLEEYVPGDPGSLYERLPRDVLGSDGLRRSAWVYLAGPAVRGTLHAAGRVRDGDWHSAGPT